jgi:hypothetical protein
VSLERTGHPEAVDVHITIGQDGILGILGRDVLNEALAAFHALEEHETIVKSTGKPGFLGSHLNIIVIGNGATDMFLLQILFRYLDILHGFDKVTMFVIQMKNALRGLSAPAAWQTPEKFFI